MWLQKIFKNLIKQKNDIIPVSNKEIISKLFIPEPTKSLLWITDADPSNIKSPSGIEININITNEGIKTETTKNSNLCSEPSMIWTKLSIEPNRELEKQPIYYPSYSELSPKQRYQYVLWLTNVEQDTNLSYVFLYYYGLERHLLIGNYDSAVEEIIRLIKYHDKGTFKAYATSALITASLYRKRYDIIKKAPFLLNEISDEALLLRKACMCPLNGRDVINLSYKVGFTNKRYINKYPKQFKKLLQKQLKNQDDILLEVNKNLLPIEESIVFGNLSIPDHIRSSRVPMIIKDKSFKDKINSLLVQTHNKIKLLIKEKKIEKEFNIL